MKPRCDTCVFYVAHSDLQDDARPNRRGRDHGTCHRYAPHPLEGGSGTGWADFEWPSVRWDDRCGEWEGRR